MEDLENKFNALSEGLLSKRKQKSVRDMIFKCEKLKAKDFMERLSLEK
jgi:hypothetical protein